MIGSEDIGAIKKKIAELSKSKVPSCSCEPGTCSSDEPIIAETAPRTQAPEPKEPKLDKVGYFVIIPETKDNLLVIEHYSYDNKLLHTIEGKDARSIYFTIIENGWVSELSHAAYLGKELEKAELSMKLGFRYVQDGM